MALARQSSTNRGRQAEPRAEQSRAEHEWSAVPGTLALRAQRESVAGLVRVVLLST